MRLSRYACIAHEAPPRISFVHMKVITVLVLWFGLGGLSACQTQPSRVTQTEVMQTEEDLAAAGFSMRGSVPPECQQAPPSLRPHHMARCMHGDRVLYAYADPMVCKCLYVGSQQAYNQFKLHEQQQQLAELMRAQRYADSAWNWGTWGPWGPGY